MDSYPTFFPRHTLQRRTIQDYLALILDQSYPKNRISISLLISDYKYYQYVKRELPRIARGYVWPGWTFLATARRNMHACEHYSRRPLLGCFGDNALVRTVRGRMLVFSCVLHLLGRYKRLAVLHRDFEWTLPRDNEERHAPAVQKRRRSMIASLRNQLFYLAHDVSTPCTAVYRLCTERILLTDAVLRCERFNGFCPPMNGCICHTSRPDKILRRQSSPLWLPQTEDFVLWIDADIVKIPSSTIEAFVSSDRDILTYVSGVDAVRGWEEVGNVVVRLPVRRSLSMTWSPTTLIVVDNIATSLLLHLVGYKLRYASFSPLPRAYSLERFPYGHMCVRPHTRPHASDAQQGALPAKRP